MILLTCTKRYPCCSHGFHSSRRKPWCARAIRLSSSTVSASSSCTSEISCSEKKFSAWSPSLNFSRSIRTLVTSLWTRFNSWEGWTKIKWATGTFSWAKHKISTFASALKRRLHRGWNPTLRTQNHFFLSLISTNTPKKRWEFLPAGRRRGIRLWW